MFKLLFALYCAVMFNILLDAEGSFLDITLLRRPPRQNPAKEQVWDVRSLDKPNNATNFTLALKKYLDHEFYGTIRVGSRSQPIQVIFDTAWTTSWLMSKDCAPSVVGCKDHHLYDHDRSAWYKRNGTKFSVNDGNNTLSGYYSFDQINYGGVKMNQSFVEMTQVPASYQDDRADGVIGLAPSFGGEKTIPEMLFDIGKIKKPIFSIYINRDYQSERGGDIMLGEINPKHIHVTNKIKDKITYVRVDPSQGQWAFQMDNVNMVIAAVKIPLCTKDCNAFVNTGSVFIYAPKAAVDEINYRIHAAPDEDNRFAVDCDKVHKLPPFNFVIGGANFTLKGIDYVHKETIRNTAKCWSVFMVGSSDWVLGNSFLSRYFSIYNFQSKVIGFVRAA